MGNASLVQCDAKVTVTVMFSRDINKASSVKAEATKPKPRSYIRKAKVMLPRSKPTVLPMFLIKVNRTFFYFYVFCSFLI